MYYSVIYSFDCPKDLSVKLLNPPKKQLRRLWQLTEGDEQRQYDYLGWDWEDSKHRKWAGILNQAEFDEFVEFCGLRAECGTMGSIGAPGFGYGWAPAIGFEAPSNEYIGGAYVTPLPETEEEAAEMEAKGWDAVQDEIMELYRELR